MLQLVLLILFSPTEASGIQKPLSDETLCCYGVCAFSSTTFNLTLRFLFGKVPGIFADETIGERNENGNDGRYAEEVNEPAIRQYFQRRYSAVGKADHDQHLCAVWDEALEDRRKCTQEGRTAAGINVELIADAFGNFAVDDDGNGIIGRSNIRNGYQCRNPKFGRILAFDKALYIAQQVRNPTGLIDHSSQAASQHGEEEDIRHAQEAFVNSLCKSQSRHISIEEPDNASQDATTGKDHE